MAELKKRAKQLGISGYSGLSKEKLISLIRSY
ncbi:Rho termination factor N-terminal domain-containing protein [Mycolicibacterium rhodesiae]|nr:Rho termination factor N-terminal domain-containing protein [Mycolicibacterium rhodesiae]